MAQNPIRKLSETTSVDKLSTQPFPASKKIYIEGSRPDINVAMREVTLDPTHRHDGSAEENSPVRIYDTSGPYTDPDIAIDVCKGLPSLRDKWIAERGDTLQLPQYSSSYTNLRDRNIALEALRFESKRKPLKAQVGHIFTHLCF